MTTLIDNGFVLGVVAKVTFAMVLGLLAAWMARRSRAAVRHALLGATFSVLLLIPIVSLLAPPIRIALAGTEDRISPVSRTPATNSSLPPAADVDDRSAVRPSGLSTEAILLAAWIAGMLGLWQVRRLRRSALPWPEGQRVARARARDVGIRRMVDVRLHSTLPVPMTCGVAHPAIVLPSDAQTWPEEDLNRALVHELEHVRRADWVSHGLARALCAAYWFHPLVWIAWRQLTLEAERACDDAVLARSEATAYADQLVALARRLSSAARPQLLAMASRADLTARVGAVLDSRQRRGRAGVLQVALACVAAALLTITIAPLTMVAAPPAPAPQVEPATLPQISIASLLVMVDVTVKDPAGNPVEGLSAGDFSVTEDGVRQTINVYEVHKRNGTPQTSYLLGYYTTNQNRDGTFRRIKVTCKDPAAQLDHRSGYYAKSAAPPPSGPATGGIFGYDTSPILIHKQEPEYSEDARRAKYQGTAMLEVEVNTEGRVEHIRVRHSLGLGLDEKAMDAVRQWRFKPALKQGQPVAVQAQVSVSFGIM
jgi:TonB family protein